tara:strand:- start:622 stop:744 length:123 start_codon:yes stop_codon:yes gene_type:complete
MAIISFFKNKFLKVKKRLFVHKVEKMSQKDQETAAYLNRI